jgi:hypothetical protein
MQKCRVHGCGKKAEYEAFLYDVYPYAAFADVFFQQDFTCPDLCAEHMVENELQSKGIRQPRGYIRYPHTNRDQAQGFTIYRPLKGR